MILFSVFSVFVILFSAFMILFRCHYDTIQVLCDIIQCTGVILFSHGCDHVQSPSWYCYGEGVILFSVHSRVCVILFRQSRTTIQEDVWYYSYDTMILFRYLMILFSIDWYHIQQWVWYYSTYGVILFNVRCDIVQYDGMILFRLCYDHNQVQTYDLIQCLIWYYSEHIMILFSRQVSQACDIIQRHVCNVISMYDIIQATFQTAVWSYSDVKNYDINQPCCSRSHFQGVIFW